MKRWRILANDGLEREGIDIFKKAGMSVDTGKRNPRELERIIGDFDGLIVRSSTRVTQRVLEAGRKRLKIVGRAGVGYDNIDLKAASEYGVVVKNAPHGNTNAAAEHTLALMLAVSRKIPQTHYAMQRGIWVKKGLVGVELTGKTLGIIGCGRIGQRVSELVPYMKVVGYDIRPLPGSGIRYLPSIKKVLRVADYVTIHTGGNSVVIGGRELALMKPTAFLINASRGENVDEEALRDALEIRKIAGAGIDVYVKEGKEGKRFRHPYEGLDNVVVTPHLGAATKEGQIGTAIEIAQGVSWYLLEGDWANSVNAHEKVLEEGKPIYQLFITHEDRDGMFGDIDTLFGGHHVGIRENPSRTLSPDRQTNGQVQTVYLLHQKPTSRLIKAIKGIDGVYLVKK